MVRWGMTPLQAIQAATINTADLFGLTGVGEIKIGYDADIVAVSGNPLEDISRLEDIRFVMKEGEKYISNNSSLYMKIPIYYLDAFTEELFSGNPAAVIFSDIEDSKLMQQIATENNLSETAFINNSDNKYSIRWFAPGCEIDLCGHATLASAYVYFQYINSGATTFEVNSIKHKNLIVSQRQRFIISKLPSRQINRTKNNYDEIEEMIGVRPKYICKGKR